VSILAADIQDRDGARALLHETRRRFPFVKRIFADAGYQGPKMANVVASSGRWKIHIVRRSDFIASSFCQNDGSWSEPSHGSAVTADWPATSNATPTVAAFVRLAMIRLMLRRLTKPTPCS
jgi:hypothetical protein